MKLADVRRRLRGWKVGRCRTTYRRRGVWVWYVRRKGFFAGMTVTTDTPEQLIQYIRDVEKNYRSPGSLLRAK